jgi:hypothetical protein
MSDSTSASPPVAPASGSAAQAPAKKHSPARLPILLVILLLVTGAYFYDRKVAGPACEEGFKKATSLLEQEHAKAGQMTAGCEAMQDALGKKPARRVDGEHYAVEKYTWRRGSLVQTYFVCVIYRKNQDGKLVLDHVMAANEEPKPEQLPGGPIVPKELTEEEKAAMAASSKGSGPPGPGPGPGGKPPADESDADKPDAGQPEKPDTTPAAKPDAAPPEKSKTPEDDKPASSAP